MTQIKERRRAAAQNQNTLSPTRNAAMSRLTTALNNDFTALCFLRDELALQVNLLEADLKDRWNALEARLETLREHLRRAEVAAGHSAKDIDAATKALIESLRTGYAEIRQALKS
jgi:hypothetical protein